MSLLDDVSIVVTPNGYKAGELYAVIPVPTEGAEEVVDGGFPTPNVNWTVSGSSTPVPAFGGGVLLSNGNKIYQSILNNSTRYIVRYEISANAGSGQLRYYDGSGYIAIDSDIGVYTLYFTTSASQDTRFYLNVDSGTSVTVSSVSVKEYTSADMDVTRATDATRVDENGLIEDVLSNVPRIDYTGGGCPHILAEPMRTNLIPYSEDFSQYTNSDTTDTANTVTSPDGTVNGTTLTASGSGSLNHIITSPTYTIASGEITSSIFAKKGTVNYIRLRLNGTTGGERAWYNLNNGTIDGEDVSGSAKIEDYGNGWYRCSLTSRSNIASGSGKSLQIFIQDSGDSQTAWTANGTENIYIWGTQTEQGSYATSYIPNFGTALGVTRNQDIFTRDGIGSLINSTEGVLFVEMAALSDDGTDRRITLTDGTVGNAINIGFSRFSGNINAEIQSGGVLQTSGWGATVVTQTNNNKFALSWGSGTMKFYVNGSPTSSQTGVTSPIGLNNLKFSLGNDDKILFAKVKQLQVYDTALTDDSIRSFNFII